MVITFVMDQYYNENNGTSISAKRFAETLIRRGHEIRIVCIDEKGTDEFGLKERNFGPINKLIHSQGMRLAKPNLETFKKAFIGSDLVHISMPFKLGREAVKACKELNIPATSAFHVQPENITSTIYLNRVRPVNYILYKGFYKNFYQNFKHIHCPSNMIANQLRIHGYKSNLHVISNGYDPSFKVVSSVEKPDEYKDKFCIAFIGRMSREKRHDVLIDAVNMSKYRDKIQLIFGGKGPLLKHNQKLASILVNKPLFSFFTKDELVKVLNWCDLYVHPADVEIEAISCIEAIACGVVPVIANSNKSATPQFALDERSLFKHGKAKELSAKIDYWIEHEQERKEMSKKYAEYAKSFSIERSIDLLIEMFNEAIEDWDKDYKSKKDKEKEPTIIKK